MNGKKEYLIVVNGVKQSIDAVDALTKQLDALDKKIETLNNKGISVKTNGGGVSKELDAQTKLEQQILSTETKLQEVRDQNYKKLLQMKDELKEFSQLAKSEAAAERNKSGVWDTNTMQGMKGKLHDLKAEMQTLDVGSERFKQIVIEANELNDKLKNIEQSYGTFSRSVGNYANGVAEGMQQVVIKVGETERTFTSAKQAAKELGNELKNMAVNGQQGTQEYKDLDEAVKQLDSTLKDVKTSSVAMDNMLDTMQSIASIASVGKGISTFFGIDDSEIEQSVQKLLALQNVMQGIEQLNQQMTTGEGIMGWLSKGNSMIDSFVEKLTGASKAQKALNTETTAGAQASKGLAAAETAQAAATTTATVATKALSLALKTIGIGLIISAVAYLITYWKEIYKWFTDTIPALKNLGVWFDKIKAVAMGVGSALINYMVQPLATVGKTIQAIINGNFSEIPKIIADGFKKTYNLVGNYQKGYNKEIERQQEKHNQKVRDQQKKANEEQLKDEEAKYGKSHKRTQEYYKKQMALVKEGSDEYKELQRRLWEDERQEREEHQRKTNSTTGGANKATIDYIAKAQEEITDITIDMMKDGLTKELAQLKVNNDKKIAEIKKNYAKEKTVREKLIEEQNKLYESKREEMLINYGIETTKLVDENTIRDIEEQIDDLNRIIEDKMKARPVFIQPLSSSEVKKILENHKEWIGELDTLYEKAMEKRTKQNEAEQTRNFNDYYKYLINFMKEKFSDKPEIEEFLGIYGNGEKEGIEKAMEYASELWEKMYGEALKYGDVFKTIQEDETKVLTKSLDTRMDAENAYYNVLIEAYENYAKKRLEKEKEVLDTEQKMRNEELIAQANKLKTEIDNTTKRRGETKDENEIRKIDEELNSLNERYDAVLNEQSILAEEYANKIVDVQRNTDKMLSEITEKAFRNFASNMRDYLAEMDKLEGKQPQYNKMGFINYNATKKQLDEVKTAATKAFGYVNEMRAKLQEAFDKGLITPEARVQTERDLSSLETSINTRLESVERKMKELPLELARQVNDMLQLVGQAATSIIQSIGQINDAAFEKQMEALDKQTEVLEKALDKQKELTEKYKNDVNNIEDELSSARGDRREHLIDQLNAQIAAQRASWAEEKRIEKEKERIDKKKDDLDDKRKRRQQKEAVTTALINAALAISNAAVNKWPIPAIPMIAAATAVGAAQVAAVRAQKYAEGGVLQGKSHAQGGIKVLGGRAEVEGGEMIVNKNTTSKNTDLLYYINSKKKRIDLNDLIEFYNEKPRKGISAIRARFAEGGVLPTSVPEINVNDRLLAAMEYYAERPYYVAVTEIENKMDDVKQVRAIAGKVN